MLLFTSSITYLAAFNLRLSADMPSFSNSFNILLLNLTFQMTEDLADQKVVFLREKSIVCDLESSLCFDEIQLEEVGNNEELSMVG